MAIAIIVVLVVVNRLPRRSPALGAKPLQEVRATPLESEVCERRGHVFHVR